MKKKTLNEASIFFFFFNEVDFKAGFEDIVQKRERDRAFQPVGTKKEEKHLLNC